MSSLRIAIGTIYIAIALIARGIWVETSTVSPAQHVPDASATSSISDFIDADGPLLNGDGAHRLDRYGNPIETAIGDYRVDPGGELYERHSPETAVARLPVPST